MSDERRKENDRLMQELVTEHLGVLIRVIQPFCDRDELEDCLHDVLECIFRKLLEGRYKETGQFRQWACRVAHNYMVSGCRRKSLQTVSLDGCAVAPASAEEHGLSLRECEEKLSALENLLKDLPEESLRLVEMRMYQGLTFREICAVESVKITTLSARFQKICRILRAAMEKMGYTDGEL